MSVRSNFLDKFLGKKIKIYLKSNSALQFRIGILKNFDDETLYLDDQGKDIIVSQTDWSNIEVFS